MGYYARSHSPNKKCLRRRGGCGQQMLKPSAIAHSTAARALRIAKVGFREILVLRTT
jgi:hypothetical protein